MHHGRNRMQHIVKPVVDVLPSERIGLHGITHSLYRLVSCTHKCGGDALVKAAE